MKKHKKLSLSNGPLLFLQDTAWELEGDTGLKFRKELIHEGDFVKAPPGKPRQEFSVTRGALKHWHKTFAEFQAEGIDVPVPIGHTSDPEKNRGKIIATELGTNKKGERALFAHIEFVDAEAAKLARTSNVSIYVPPKFLSGSGCAYKWQIGRAHV